MRVQYVASLNLPASNASGIQISQTCKALSQVGVDVTIVLLRWSDNIDVLRTYYQLEGVSIVNIPGSKISAALGIISYRLETIFSLFCFKLFLVENGIQIYTREPLMGIFSSSHVQEVHVLPQKISYFTRWLLFRARKLVCISNGLKEKLICLGYNEKDILVAHDGVNLEYYKSLPNEANAREKLGLLQNKKILVYTGSLLTRRGFGTIVNFIKNIPQNTQLYIIGKVEKTLMNEVGNLENIVIVGVRPHQEIPLWQRAADVLILINTNKDHILRDYTSPMKLFEYMASGRPIIVSNVPSSREILNEHNSLLVEPDSARALIDGINTIFKDYPAALVRADRASKDVQKYSWDSRAKSILNFLKQ